MHVWVHLLRNMIPPWAVMVAGNFDFNGLPRWVLSIETSAPRPPSVLLLVVDVLLDILDVSLLE